MIQIQALSSLKEICEQITKLRQLFPAICGADKCLMSLIDSGCVSLPNDAGKWIAIPNWLSCQEEFGETYPEAVVSVLTKLQEVNPGNMRIELTDDWASKCQLYRTKATEVAWNTICSQQHNHDIIIMAVQIGKRHKGKNVKVIRELIEWPEYGLGAFEIGIMILQCPSLLSIVDGGGINCVGDEYDTCWGHDGRKHVPCFSLERERMVFGANYYVGPSSQRSCASGFILKTARKNVAMVG